MSVMFNVVFASRCRSTHHKLAMDALRHVRGDDSVLWRNLFLKYHGSYLEGAKAPDDTFKDFKNHVLHVKDGWWGGAIKATQTWYDRTVHALKKRDWEEAVYSAGVLSHYYTDPCQPFHTGQTEAEGAVHRAAEWSICKCYHEFQNILEADLGGYPDMELPTTPEWLADHVKAGAAAAHEHYEACIDHYDLARGVKNPLSGMDQEMKDRVARMVGHAVVGFSRLLERAFDESFVQPPRVELTLDSLIAQVRRPVNWIVKQMADVKDRYAVMEMWRELQASGKVIEELPEDDRLVRRLHAQEVRGIAIGELDAEPARAPGSAYGEGAPKRHRSAEPVTARARGSRPRYTRSTRMEPSTVAGVATVAGMATRAEAARMPVTPERWETGRTGYSTVAATNVVTPPRSPAAVPVTTGSAVAIPTNMVLTTQTVVDEGRPAQAWNAPRVAALPERQPANPPPMPRSAPVEARIAPLVSRPVSTPAPPEIESYDRSRSARIEPEERRVDRDTVDREEADRRGSDRAFEYRLANEPPAPAPEPRERDRGERVDRETTSRTRFESEPSEPVAFERERQDRERAVRERPDTVPMSREVDELFQERSVERSEGLERGPTSTRVLSTSRPTAAPQSGGRTQSAGGARKFYLEASAPVADGPSIGNKTAERLRAAGVRTVADLLKASPEKTAARVSQKWITADLIRQWQDQARLVCTIPDLRGHDAQVLVGCGILSADALSRQRPQQLLETVEAFCATSAGERALRGGTQPDLAEVTDWIDAAASARELKVA
jgi:hypothetical protein